MMPSFADLFFVAAAALHAPASCAMPPVVQDSDAVVYACHMQSAQRWYKYKAESCYVNSPLAVGYVNLRNNAVRQVMPYNVILPSEIDLSTTHGRALACHEFARHIYQKCEGHVYEASDYEPAEVIEAEKLCED